MVTTRASANRRQQLDLTPSASLERTPNTGDARIGPPRRVTKRPRSSPSQGPRKRPAKRARQVSPTGEAQSSGRTDFSFRVTGIPKCWDQSKLQQFLLEEGFPAATVKSFALNMNSRDQVATIIFQETPMTMSDRGALKNHRTISIPSSHSLPTSAYISIEQQFLGLTVLSSPPPEYHKIDIIAISGIGSHGFGSFKDKDSDFMWLRDVLPTDIIQDGHSIARIMIYGYDSRIPDSTSFQNLEDIAVKFGSSISNLASVSTKKPILLIAHSLGGLIAKQSILHLSNSSREEDLNGFRAIRSIAFFGVPHTGMDNTSLRSMAGDGPNRELVESLSSQNSQVLTILNRGFGELLNKPELLHIFYFYETKKSPTTIKDANGKWFMGGPLAVLVSKFSATHSEKGPEYICSIARSHSEMVKFRPNDDEYHSVLSKLRGLVDMTLKPRNDLLKADAWIKTECYTEKALEIRRLSGARLSMKQCYINLILLEHDRNHSPLDELAPDPANSSILDRLNVIEPNKSKQINLPTLFRPRNDKNGRTRQPRRIYIRGRAGVGKTTLCKKIVHDFVHHNLWSDIFDRVLWVPLRRIPRSQNTNNLKSLLKNEFFALHSQPDDLLRALCDACDRRDGSRTLFILDGLDEIWLVLSPDENLYRFVLYLLNQPHVIVTSRPSVGSMPDVDLFDLELDTVGFYRDQQMTYVKAAQEEASASILSFFNTHPIVRDLARIPIQLDALCYSWQDYSHDHPETMTELYRAIEVKLWKKDCIRLVKTIQGRPVNENDSLYDDDIDKMIEKESQAIECLAFFGLCELVTVFNARFRARVSKHLTQRDRPLDEILQKVSFMRSSAASAPDERGDFYFLHLTFQEYFAARHFVRHWIKGDNLYSLDAKQNEPVQPKTFFQERKYSPRFNIVWRFVVGLLSADPEPKEDLRKFFGLIQAQPRDIIGTSHIRLLMHCLHEIRRSEDFEDRKKLEDHLKAWLIFQCKIYSVYAENDEFSSEITTLATEVEFPEGIIFQILDEENTSVTGPLLLSITQRFMLPIPAMRALGILLRHQNLIPLVQDVLRECRGQLEGHTSQNLINLLQNEDENIQSSASKVLATQATLPETTISSLVLLLETANKSAIQHVFYVLEFQSNVSHPTIELLVRLLDDPDSDLREHAADILRCQRTLSGSVIDCLTERLELSDTDMLYHLVRILGAQSPVSAKVANCLIRRLECPDSSVRGNTANTLGNQSALSASVINLLAQRLEDLDASVRGYTAIALGNQSALSVSVINLLAQRLEDPDASVRIHTAYALGKQSALSTPVINLLAQRLEDPDASVRIHTAYALGNQSALSASVINLLAQRLEDPDASVRIHTAIALGNQLALSVSVINLLAQRLKDPDASVRIHTAIALGNQSALSASVINLLAQRLEDPDASVRGYTAIALGKQSALSTPVINLLAQQLEDPSFLLRHATCHALKRHGPLSEQALSSITSSFATAYPQFDQFMTAYLISSQQVYSAVIGRVNKQKLLISLLKMSFSTPLSWYCWRNILFLESNQIFKHIPQNRGFSWIQEAHKELKYPVYSTWKL